LCRPSSGVNPAVDALLLQNNNFSNVFMLNEGLPELRGLYMEGNGLGSMLPPNFFAGFMPKLEHIHLPKNKMGGPLPEMST